MFLPRSRSCLFALALLLTSAVPSLAAPQVDWMFPEGGQRGTTVEVGLHGSGLADLNGVTCTATGVRVELLPASSPTRSKTGGPADNFRTLRITMAPDAPLAISDIRVFDSTGLSARKLFQVGQWPEFQEAEPNNSPEEANPITLPVTVNGRIHGPSDVDCYRFTAKAGEAISCEVHAERLLSMIGEGPLEGYLEVLDAQGRTLAENNGHFGWDPLINFTVPADGEYTVRFRDLLWRDASTAVYRLTIGAVPFVESFFPTGGRPGGTANLTVAGINVGNGQPVAIPAGEPGDIHEVRLKTPLGESNPLPFALGDYPQVDEQEPNDTVEQANPVPIPVLINGRLEKDGDIDRFRFHADKGQRLVMEVFASRVGSPVDSLLFLRNGKGQFLIENDDAKGSDSLLDYTFLEAGDYVVGIRDIDNRGGPDFTYQISIGPPRPSFRLTVTPDGINVPAGGAARLNVRLERQSPFDGEVRLHVEGLPPGVTASTAIIPKGSDRAILTLQATAAPPPLRSPDAQLTSMAPAAAAKPSSPGADARPALIRVVGVAEVDGKAVPHNAQAAELYMVQGRTLQRPSSGPIALLCNPTPVMLGSASLQVAVDTGGVASFSVRIIRQPGGKDPVALQVDGLPAGVTADPVIAAPDANSATVTLRADGDAAAGEADIVVTGLVPGTEGKNANPVVLAVTPAIHFTVNETAGFFLTVEPKTVALTAGKTASIRVNVTRRGGFTGAVDLTIAGLPAGVTAAPAHIDAGKHSATLVLQGAAIPIPQPPANTTAAAPEEFHVEGTAVVGGQKQVQVSKAVTIQGPG